MSKASDSFKLQLLLEHLRIRCRHFKGSKEECGLSEENGLRNHNRHLTYYCDGDINKCDLPDDEL